MSSPDFLDQPHDLARALAKVVELVAALEQRLGRLLFKDILALHFSPSRPKRNEEWTDHPVIVLLVREIERARDDSEVHPEVDAFCSAVFFLLGIYGVLSTTDSAATRDTMLSKLTAAAMRSLELRRFDSHDTQFQSFVRNPSIRRSSHALGTLRYVAAWGGTGLIIWFWYWLFSNIGTF